MKCFGWLFSITFGFTYSIWVMNDPSNNSLSPSGLNHLFVTFSSHTCTHLEVNSLLLVFCLVGLELATVSTSPATSRSDHTSLNKKEKEWYSIRRFCFRSGLYICYMRLLNSECEVRNKRSLNTVLIRSKGRSMEWSEWWGDGGLYNETRKQMTEQLV